MIFWKWKLCRACDGRSRSRNCRFFGIEFLKIYLFSRNVEMCRFSKIETSAQSLHPTVEGQCHKIPGLKVQWNSNKHLKYLKHKTVFHQMFRLFFTILMTIYFKTKGQIWIRVNNFCIRLFWILLLSCFHIYSEKCTSFKNLKKKTF